MRSPRPRRGSQTRGSQVRRLFGETTQLSQDWVGWDCKLTSAATDDVFMGGFTAAMGNPKEMHRSWRESHQSFISQAALPAFYTTPTTKQ